MNILWLFISDMWLSFLLLNTDSLTDWGFERTCSLNRLLHSYRTLPYSTVVKVPFLALHSFTRLCLLLLGTPFGYHALCWTSTRCASARERLCPTECALRYPSLRSFQLISPSPLMTKLHSHPWQSGIKYFFFVSCIVLKISQSMTVLPDIG